MPWLDRLNADPLPWLLERDTLAVRHRALRELLGRPADDPEVIEARTAAMLAPPIAPILAAQAPDGWWVKPGAGYAPKYTGTVWSLIVLDQMAADGSDARIRQACDYVLDHSRAVTGGFGASGVLNRPPPPSEVVHCLNGNLVRALIGFGWLDDERLQAAIDWEVAAILGSPGHVFYRSTTAGKGFACGINEGLPCAWGAIKGLLGLARVPAERRTPDVSRAIETGVEFLLSRDPADADYPMGWGNTRPNEAWFRPGFPSGYIADVLQDLELLCELGHGADPRLQRALAWLVSLQDRQGRWLNRYRYAGRLWADVDDARTPSKWVTLRAVKVLSMVDRGVVSPEGLEPSTR